MRFNIKTNHIVRRGETLSEIAGRYGVTVAYLMALNAITNPHLIYVGQAIRIADENNGSGGMSYVVQRGDTLARIAQQFGVNVWMLAQVNNLRDIHLIYVGQTLMIPDTTMPS